MRSERRASQIIGCLEFRVLKYAIEINPQVDDRLLRVQATYYGSDLSNTTIRIGDDFDVKFVNWSSEVDTISMQIDIRITSRPCDPIIHLHAVLRVLDIAVRITLQVPDFDPASVILGQ